MLMIEKNNKMWYRVCRHDVAKDRTISAVIEIGEDSPWFDGHFPGQPILPGIAQLAMVKDLLEKSLDGPLKIKKVGRVRFKQMVVPEDRILILIKPGKRADENTAFRILKKDELVCSGIIEFYP